MALIWSMHSKILPFSSATRPWFPSDGSLKIPAGAFTSYKFYEAKCAYNLINRSLSNPMGAIFFSDEKLLHTNCVAATTIYKNQLDKHISE